MDGTIAAPVLVGEGPLVVVAALPGLIVDDTVAVLPPVEADPLLDPLILPVLVDDPMFDVTKLPELTESDGLPVDEIDKLEFEASDEPEIIDAVVEPPPPPEGSVVPGIDTPVDRMLSVAKLDVTIDGGLDVPVAVEAAIFDEATVAVTELGLPLLMDETCEVKADPLAVGPRVPLLLRPRAYGPKAWVVENEMMIGNRAFGNCRRGMLFTTQDEVASPFKGEQYEMNH